MLGVLALTFVAGCIVGAAVNDLARWHQQRSAAQYLLRALDSGTVYYGRRERGQTAAQQTQEEL